jgi:hypothetical protein
MSGIKNQEIFYCHSLVIDNKINISLTVWIKREVSPMRSTVIILFLDFQQKSKKKQAIQI